MKKRLVVQVTNVDDNLAEDALKRAVKAIGEVDLVNIVQKSLVIEPHDDFRGIISRFDYSYKNSDADSSKNASKALYDLLSVLIKARLWHIPTVKITIETGAVKN